MKNGMRISRKIFVDEKFFMNHSIVQVDGKSRSWRIIRKTAVEWYRTRSYFDPSISSGFSTNRLERSGPNE